MKIAEFTLSIVIRDTQIEVNQPGLEPPPPIPFIVDQYGETEFQISSNIFEINDGGRDRLGFATRSKKVKSGHVDSEASGRPFLTVSDPKKVYFI